MMSPQQAERVLRAIECMDRAQIVAQMRRCRAPFPIDFTPEWLARQPLEELRHVYAAICLQCGLVPDGASASPTRAA